MSGEVVESVEVFLATLPVTPAANDAAEPHWQVGVASPLARYADFREERYLGGRHRDQRVIVRVRASSGETGVAPVAGGLPTAIRIVDDLAGLVVGEAVADHRRIWDRMTRAMVRDGSKGSAIYPCAGIDLAVWDLHGRVLGVPVHELIGGGRSEPLRLYATGPAFEHAARRGFSGAKVPLRYGPSAGRAGFEANVASLTAARAAVPDSYPLMVDCWMALNVDYAVELMHAIEPLGFDWLEEPVMPEDYWAHAEIRRRAPRSIRLAAGEHEYGLHGMRMLIERGKVDIIQPDVYWSGLTELLDVAAFARAHGTTLIPHGSTPFAAHLVASRPELDILEYYMSSTDGVTMTPQYPAFEGECVPADGRLPIPRTPGFGLTVRPDVTLHSVPDLLRRLDRL